MCLPIIATNEWATHQEVRVDYGYTQQIANKYMHEVDLVNENPSTLAFVTQWLGGSTLAQFGEEYDEHTEYKDYTE